MAPLWFASNSNQPMSSVRQHPPMRMHPHGPPPPRGVQPANVQVPGPAPAPGYPRVPPMRGPQYPPVNHNLNHNHGPHHRPMGNSMGPLPPMGPGPGRHMPPGKSRAFAPHPHPPPPPPMRMPAPGSGRPHPNYPPPPPPGRMNYPPHMHRQLPPRTGPLNHGMPPHHMPRVSASMPPLMGPPRIQHQMTGAPVSGPPPSHAPVQPPLRELNNRNIPQNPNHLSSPHKHTIELKPTPKETTTKATSQALDAATDAAEILLGLRRIPSPLPSSTCREKDDEAREDTPSLATLSDEPICLPTRLAVPEDESKLNSMHCFLRSDLLELFVVERSRSPKHSSKPDSPTTIETETKQGYKVGCASGRVGLRCVHCAMARVRNASSDGEAPMAVFYPKSISELYRLVTSWQRVHLRKCRNLPPSVRETYEKTRQDKSRGKTQWWVTSAKEIGLVDCASKAGGIRFGVAPNGLSA